MGGGGLHTENSRTSDFCLFVSMELSGFRDFRVLLLFLSYRCLLRSCLFTPGLVPGLW